MQSVPLWLQVAGLISQVVTGVLTLAILIWSYLYTAKVTREIKRADVLMEVNRKFDALCRDCEDLARHNAGDARYIRYYYQRYWSLQSQQFQYWLQGLVTDTLFFYWMSNRQYDFTVNTELCGVDFNDGWKQAKKGARFDSDFIKLIEEISLPGTDIEEAMRKYKPKLQINRMLKK